MYSNAPKKQKHVNFQTSRGHGPQRTAVHGHASHPLLDVIWKPQAGYRGEKSIHQQQKHIQKTSTYKNSTISDELKKMTQN